MNSSPFCKSEHKFEVSTFSSVSFSDHSARSGNGTIYTHAQYYALPAVNYVVVAVAIMETSRLKYASHCVAITAPGSGKTILSKISPLRKGAH